MPRGVRLIRVFAEVRLHFGRRVLRRRQSVRVLGRHRVSGHHYAEQPVSAVALNDASIGAGLPDRCGMRNGEMRLAELRHRRGLAGARTYPMRHPVRGAIQLLDALGTSSRRVSVYRGGAVRRTVRRGRFVARREGRGGGQLMKTEGGARPCRCASPTARTKAGSGSSFLRRVCTTLIQ